MSTRLSPFTVEVDDPPKFRELAERRFSAISNDERVRVDGSLNMLTTVKPLSVGTCLMRRSLTCLNFSAVSSISMRSSAEYSVMSIRCLWENDIPYSPPVFWMGAAPARSPGPMARISTAEVPSMSFRNRRTFSSEDEGTFLPT